ncbi:NrfD/PsrC family molybdoenzyme membrane anchor subunit [Sulfuricystis multivorans]|uniref:NrfD/PsrC family molybdoenzyme membrane anchor subunit n=1 Tax=Sulfuricystis multivorans TaxID=2211108 RepID=UPI000F81CE3F|nr:NrfD/PsrC family molybdoenzyme membrane anchor subunit [Sulfuricystis multivorans]
MIANNRNNDISSHVRSEANAWLVACIIVGGLSGAYMLYQLMTVGHASFNTSSDGINWGLPIAAYVFFALTSSGLTMIASLATVFGFEQFYPIVKRCIWVAIVTLVAGFSVLAFELGHPFRMLWAMPTGMQVMSPMFWMGVFYLIDLVLLIIKFYLIVQEDWHSSFSRLIGIAGFVAVILASGMLGLLFGSVAMRPMWFGSFTSIYYMLTAALSGAAAIVVTTYMAFDFDSRNMPANLRAFAEGDQMPKVFATLIGITLVMILTRMWTGLWSNLDGLEGFHVLVKSPLFWVELLFGLVLPFWMMLQPGMQTRVVPQMTAAFLVLGGMAINRYEFIVSGQVVPMFKGTWVNSLEPYFPSMTEWAMAVFGLAVALGGYAIGEKMFRLSAAPAHEESGKLAGASA